MNAYVDDWAVLTVGRYYLGLSNTAWPSIRYHYRNQSEPDYALILSPTKILEFGPRLLVCDALMYPDLPNMAFYPRRFH